MVEKVKVTIKKNNQRINQIHEPLELDADIQSVNNQILNIQQKINKVITKLDVSETNASKLDEDENDGDDSDEDNENEIEKRLLNKRKIEKSLDDCKIGGKGQKKK